MMLCCCRKGNSSYALGEDDKKQPQQQQPTNSINAQDAHIKTGKGALSSSNQSIGPEAELDKGTVAATQQRQSTPPVVTEQPLQSSIAAPQQNQQSSNNSSINNSVSDKVVQHPVEISQIKPQVNSVSYTPAAAVAEKAVDNNQTSSSSSSSSQPQHTSTIKIESSSPRSSSINTNQNANKSVEVVDKIKLELDSIELAIAEAEKLTSVREVKSVIPQLASQLQALTLQVTEAGQKGQGHSMADIQSAVSRLEAVTSRLEALAAKGGKAGSGSSDEVAPFVLEFDAIVSGPLAQFLKLSGEVGGDVQKQADMVKAAFQAERDFLVVASKSKKPSEDVFMELMKPIAAKIVDISSFREDNRRSEFFNHLSTISESVGALGWITMSPAPSQYVKDLLDAGVFYSNRVLKDFKGKDAKHVDWTKAWTAVLSELQAYVKSSHTTGVSWNPQGVDAKSCAASSAPAPPTSGGPPPPPPPPGPPPPPADLGSAQSGPSDSAKNALFASINQGDSVTSGLKRVTKDMQTHKNPTLRQGPAPFKPAKPTPAAKPQAPKPAAPVAKPPVLELEGKKWTVEYQKDNKSIVIDGDIKQTVYAYKCEGSVIQVKGKINSVVLDSCKKTAVVFEDVLSSVEFINCQSVQGQVTGKLNILSIDKTDGCQFYLSKASLGIEIVSAKSSEMNILIPTDDGDFKEFALPEQYKTKFDGKTMVTTVAESI